MAALLTVRDRVVRFAAEDGITRAADGVSFEIAAGETLGLVGESGSGKSVTALSLLQLLPAHGVTTAGEVIFNGTELTALGESELRAVRGRDIAMIFQEPMTSLNPALTIGHQIAEVVRIHRRADKATARVRALEVLELVRLPDAARRLEDYPHQLSGGQRQRVMIAMALACDPKLLIADEPTTALDVTIQAQVLDLMRDLKARTGAAILLITHDLGVVAEMCDRVAVMYAGRIVETAPVKRLFDAPAHPYTRGLLKAVQRGRPGQRLQRLHEIPGSVPNLKQEIAGCPFGPRCAFTVEACRTTRPILAPVTDLTGHTAACLRVTEVAAS